MVNNPPLSKDILYKYRELIELLSTIDDNGAPVLSQPARELQEWWQRNWDPDPPYPTLGAYGGGKQ